MSEEVKVGAKAGKKRVGTGRKKSPSRVPAKLSRAAVKVLANKGEEIAESLGQHAAKGNIQSARLLLELAERPSGENNKGSRSEPSLAESWSAEPEWSGEEPHEG